MIVIESIQHKQREHAGCMNGDWQERNWHSIHSVRSWLMMLSPVT